MSLVHVHVFTCSRVRAYFRKYVPLFSSHSFFLFFVFFFLFCVYRGLFALCWRTPEREIKGQVSVCLLRDAREIRGEEGQWRSCIFNCERVGRYGYEKADFVQITFYYSEYGDRGERVS